MDACVGAIAGRSRASGSARCSGRNAAASACMDLSDGLADAVRQIAAASRHRRDASKAPRCRFTPARARTGSARRAGSGRGARRRRRRLRAALRRAAAAPAAGSPPSIRQARGVRRHADWRADRGSGARPRSDGGSRNRCPTVSSTSKRYAAVAPQRLAAGWTSCSTRMTRRSGRRWRSRSACSSGSRRSSVCTPFSGWRSRSLFDLNRVAVLLGIYSNLPWILPAYYTVATIAGAAILGVEVPPGLLKRAGSRRGRPSWARLPHAGRHALTPLAWAYVLGSTFGAVVLALIAYRVAW